MAKRRTASEWQAFLRGLARTGNARAAAAEAGMDVGTAYDRRIKDAGFFAKWDAALVKAKARPSPRPSPASGRGSSSELVLRRTMHGDKLVRAAEGRWCARTEASFLAGLEATGCVRSAAAAAGISPNALYERRKHYPEFAARWDEVAGRAAQELPAMLQAAARDSLSRPPETPGCKRRGRARLPRIDVDQAIRISAIAAKKEAGANKRGMRPRVATNEEVREALTKRLAAFGIRIHAEHLAEGWTETQDGHLIPPGWIYVGAGDGEAEAAEGDGTGGESPGS